MRRTRRRGGPRVQWMPVFGNTPVTGEFDPNDNAIGLNYIVQLDGAGQIRWEATALTFDYSDSAAQDQGEYLKSLQDLVAGNNWRLRRIVGKIFGSWRPNAEGSTLTTPSFIDFAAGFIVCKTDDQGNPTTDFSEVNPLVQDSAEDPWIWRRRWVIGCYTDTDSISNPDLKLGQRFPAATTDYGSAVDGPHIDQKTARIIGRSERLFFVIAGRVMDPIGENFDFATPGTLYAMLDYRLLGSLITRAPGNRRNASR